MLILIPTCCGKLFYAECTVCNGDNVEKGYECKQEVTELQFFKVLMNLRNPNYENGEQPSFRNHLGLIQVPLKVKDIPELVSIFFFNKRFL